MKKSWYDINRGKTIGTKGSEGGVIGRDQEYERFSRITLEKEGRIAPFTITCGIYGWMFHTVYFRTMTKAEDTFAKMQKDLSSIVDDVPANDDSDAEGRMSAASILIAEFVDRYPIQSGGVVYEIRVAPASFPERFRIRKHSASW